RGLGLGKPMLVSDVGWFAELPDGVALKIPVDEYEVATIAAALELAADHAGELGRAARHYVRREHDRGRKTAGSGAARQGPAARGHRFVAPWIMGDEIVYSELAKSFAAHGHFLVRGVPSHGYGFVYPILLAPAWRLFSSVPDAYVAAKLTNSVVMSLAAVPA